MAEKYLEPLTWLRGLAAFFVIVHHCFYVASAQYGAADIPSYFSPLNFLDLGTFAVALFFALSGCTLTLNYTGAINSWRTYRDYIFKRFMRIWPAFALSLVVCILFKALFKYCYIGSEEHWVAYLLRDYQLINIFQYLFLVNNISAPENVFLNVYWTLPVEFQYYLVLPIALALMKNAFSKCWVPAVFAATGYIIYQKQLIIVENHAVFKMAYIFFGGAALASLVPYIKGRLPFKLAAGCFVLLLILLGLLRHEFLIIPPTTPFFSDLGNVYGAAALGVIALALLISPLEKKYRFFNFLKYYGEISYSLYLFHIFFVATAALLVIHLQIFGGIAKLLFVLTFSLVGSYLLSGMTYRHVELAGISYGRHLLLRLRTRI